MNKEYLEAFERMTEHLDLEDEYSYKQLFEDEKIIKQALQRLESIENAKPSEALNITNSYLKVFEEENADVLYDIESFKQDFITIKQALIKAQEQEKVLKIVFKKQVDINEIKILLANLRHCDDVERCKRYNASRKVGYKLKQEEFDLLKRYCNDNI